MVQDDFAWLRARVDNLAARFDGCRIDHVVGLFRQWVRQAGRAGFVPEDEGTQIEHGQRLLGLLHASAPGLRWFAEDLGDVPDYVRAALRARQIPGYRVLRWEWEGTGPRDPRTFPACSVATWGTHDTSSLAVWWERELDEAGRRQVATAPGFEAVAESATEKPPYEGLLYSLYAAASDDVTVPLPDTYGGTERINEPGTVGSGNWDYRVPWPVEELDHGPAKLLAERLRALCQHTGRLP
jgi:4-alpha-glucanotransferase